MKLKITQHPRMHDITIGDEVYCHPLQLFAPVVDTFPAAVCVRVGVLSFQRTIDLLLAPQLWRAEDIENLSVCRYCHSRENLHDDALSGVPFRVCTDCRGK